MKIFGMGVLFVSMTAFVTAYAMSQDENPNGFPSGPHYNMNIIGKKVSFTCPAPELDPITGAPIYGNVVFVPESGQGIQIYMQSGSTKGKAAAITELRVIDPCAGIDGNGATVQLPPNAAGYRVYARALAKPTDYPSMTILPSLVAAVDESGNDLMYLGLVTDRGFVRSDGITVTRTKGKSVATNVTGLFEWSGDVCYFTALDGTYTETQKCVIDLDGDGIYDDAEAPVDGVCPAGYSLISTFCKTYEEEWVFNIADFVEYLWSLDNSGSKLVQIRFYPN
jgi:hypothetical protein